MHGLMRFPIHEHPHDYWRFTPRLRSLAQGVRVRWADFAANPTSHHTVWASAPRRRSNRRRSRASGPLRALEAVGAADTWTEWLTPTPPACRRTRPTRPAPPAHHPEADPRRACPSGSSVPSAGQAVLRKVGCRTEPAGKHEWRTAACSKRVRLAARASTSTACESGGRRLARGGRAAMRLELRLVRGARAGEPADVEDHDPAPASAVRGIRRHPGGVRHPAKTFVYARAAATSRRLLRGRCRCWSAASVRLLGRSGDEHLAHEPPAYHFSLSRLGGTWTHSGLRGCHALRCSALTRRGRAACRRVAARARWPCAPCAARGIRLLRRTAR